MRRKIQRNHHKKEIVDQIFHRSITTVSAINTVNTISTMLMQYSKKKRQTKILRHSFMKSRFYRHRNDEKYDRINPNKSYLSLSTATVFFLRDTICSHLSLLLQLFHRNFLTLCCWPD